jgi:hypothetical protein
LRLVKDQGWGKTHLAKEVGAAEGQVYRWLKGEPISSQHLGRLAEVLGTSRRWIMIGQGPMYVERERVPRTKNAPRH